VRRRRPAYRDSYFDMYPGIWRHGDWIRITPRGGAIIYGRSDATINRHGIRMGTAELYRAVEALPEVVDSLVVDLEYLGRESYMPLFVVLREGLVLDDALTRRLKDCIRSALSARHVPNEIFQVASVPRTLSGKKMELPVKKLLLGASADEVFKLDAMANADSVQWFAAFAERYRGQLGEVAAAVEDEWMRAGAARARLDLADEDHVVAFLVAAAVEALEHRGSTFEQRHAARAEPKGNALEAVDVLAREAHREVMLVGGEDVDRVVRAALERRHRAGLARQAPEDQRRRDRDRVEGVRGEADRRAVGAARGDDRHAGGEHRQRGTEVVAAERRWSSARDLAHAPLSTLHARSSAALASLE
jgi:hypothetical protein